MYRVASDITSLADIVHEGCQPTGKSNVTSSERRSNLRKGQAPLCVETNTENTYLSTDTAIMPTYRQLSLSVNKEASIRTASFDNEEYLVVPCICLIGDSVVFGLNAKGPEFIPAEEIAFSTPQWSGRPVVPNHPNKGNTTANLPHILESQRFGWTFYPEFTDNKLKMEAWLSRSRAEKVGDSAMSVITNLESGIVVELSVGAWVEIEEREGTAPNGEQYIAVWHGIASDHLALGLEGGVGACSIDMGCGGLRVNANSDGNDNSSSSDNDNNATCTYPLVQSSTLLHENENHVIPESESIGVTMATNTATGTVPVTSTTSTAAATTTQPTPPTPIANDKELGLLSRLMSHFRMPSLRSNIEDTGPSDWNVRSQIADALYMSEPGFGWVEDVFQDSGTVIYSVFPFSPHEKYYRRTFTIGANDVITLGESKEQVKKPMDRWETMTSGDSTVTSEMAATGANPSSIPSCSCNRDRNQTATSTATAANNREGEPITMASPELINRFASVPDEKLTKLLASLEDGATATPPNPSNPPSTPPSTPPTTPTPAPSDPPPSSNLTPEQTEEQYLANAPDSVKQIVAEHKAQAAARRTVLLGALSSQSVFTKEQLALKSNAELEQLVALANVNDPNAVEVDYSFARATPAAMGGSYKNQPAPDPYAVKFGRNMHTGEKIETKTN